MHAGCVCAWAHVCVCAQTCLCIHVVAHGRLCLSALRPSAATPGKGANRSSRSSRPCPPPPRLHCRARAGAAAGRPTDAMAALEEEANAAIIAASAGAANGGGRPPSPTPHHLTTRGLWVVACQHKVSAHLLFAPGGAAGCRAASPAHAPARVVHLRTSLLPHPAPQPGDSTVTALDLPIFPTRTPNHTHRPRAAWLCVCGCHRAEAPRGGRGAGRSRGSQGSRCVLVSCACGCP